MSSVIHEPTQRHRCQPPRYRPNEEWRTMPAPLGWLKPTDRDHGLRLTIPTEYRPGTVWVCTCGDSWIRRAGQHYGRNPNLGHVEGSWSIAPWYAFKIRRRIAAYEHECGYARDKAIVESFVLPRA